jgi:hypothetical protein
MIKATLLARTATTSTLTSTIVIQLQRQVAVVAVPRDVIARLVASLVAWSVIVQTLGLGESSAS